MLKIRGSNPESDYDLPLTTLNDENKAKAAWRGRLKSII